MDEYNEVLKDEMQDRFTKLEPPVAKIFQNMTILMVDIENNFEPFSYFCISNLEAS